MYLSGHINNIRQYTHNTYYYNFGNYDLGWEIQLGRGLKQG